MGQFDDVDMVEEESSGDIEGQNKNEERVVAFYAENIKCLAYCTGIGLVALILGLGLGLGLEGGSSGSPVYGDKSQEATSTRNYMVSLAKTISPDAKLTTHLHIPQTKALDWMSTDPFTIEEVKKTTPKDSDLLQRYVMASFYYATNGQNWNHQINFLSADHICNWRDGKVTMETDYMKSPSKGVLCEDNVVKALVFDNNYLKGILPDELYSLKSIQKIDFAGNYLNGGISNKLSDLKSLKIFKVNQNKLNGELNNNIGSLSYLEYFNINNNYLKGNIENLFQNLTNLEIFDIGDNLFSGKFPDISASTKLKEIHMQLNGYIAPNPGFSGKIPKYLGNFLYLSTLNLSGNSFSGDIPSELGQVQGLIRLDLHTNQFSGQVPNELLALKKLDKLYMNGNDFTGDFDNVCYELDDIHMTADCLSQNNTYVKVLCDCCSYCCNDRFCCPSGETAGSPKCMDLDYMSLPQW